MVSIIERNEPRAEVRAYAAAPTRKLRDSCDIRQIKKKEIVSDDLQLARAYVQYARDFRTGKRSKRVV